jgi:hypothetical protein
VVSRTGFINGLEEGTASAVPLVPGKNSFLVFRARNEKPETRDDGVRWVTAEDAAREQESIGA